MNTCALNTCTLNSGGTLSIGYGAFTHSIQSSYGEGHTASNGYGETTTGSEYSYGEAHTASKGYSGITAASEVSYGEASTADYCQVRADARQFVVDGETFTQNVVTGNSVHRPKSKGTAEPFTFGSVLVSHPEQISGGRAIVSTPSQGESYHNGQASTGRASVSLLGYGGSRMQGAVSRGLASSESFGAGISILRGAVNFGMAETVMTGRAFGVSTHAAPQCSGHAVTASVVVAVLTRHHKPVCRGYSHISKEPVVLKFQRDDCSSASLNSPTSITILQYERA